VKVLMVSKASTVASHRGKLAELVKLGVDLTVIVPPRWGAQPLERTEGDGYELRVLPCWFTPYNHFHFYPARIGKLQADLVYLEEEPWSLVTRQFMRLCVRAGKPAIFVTWQNIYKNYPPPFNRFEKYVFKHAAAGVAGTGEIAEILRKKGFAHHISIIPLGVDAHRFRKLDAYQLKKALGLEGAFVVGFTGRLVPIKAIPDLICALAQLPADCALLILGDGECRQELQNLAASSGVASRVRWIPWVPSLEVPEYLNAMDVLVLPSRTMPKAKEQFGRVIIEAMACEKPTIGSSSGGIPELIGDAGLVFPEGDAGALADRIRSLYQSVEKREQLGRKGRVRVLEHYSYRRLAEKHLDLFQSVLQGHLAQHPERPQEASRQTELAGTSERSL